MTDLPQYYRGNVTWVPTLDRRLAGIADLVVARRPVSVLDLGCGAGVLLDSLVTRLPDAQLVGVDAVPPPAGAAWRSVTGDIAGRLPLADGSFELVVAGEVIEHVPHPDRMLAEIRRVLVPGGALVLSTPNIVGWANRVLVPLGIQPLFTETSSEVHLGRRWSVLGQGNQVQGHLKVFSPRALSEILHRTGFRVIGVRGMPAEFPPPVDRLDRLFARRPALASDLLVWAVRAPQLSPSDPPRRKVGPPAAVSR